VRVSVGAAEEVGAEAAESESAELESGYQESAAWVGLEADIRVAAVIPAEVVIRVAATRAATRAGTIQMIQETAMGERTRSRRPC
jgi:hypothetical protein